jgi:uncharacterized membrane protein YcaP (DUF421 family)
MPLPLWRKKMTDGAIEFLQDILLGDPPFLERVLVVGILTYLALIVIIRISGKRTLAAMNIFDFIVTVALGSTLASTIVSRDVSVAEGVLALGVLVGLQYLVSWLSVRYKGVEKLVKSQPRLLYYEGEFLTDAMRAERITESEIWQALRAQGIGEPGQVDAIILETNGNISMLPQKKDRQPERSLTNVVGPGPRE